MPREEAAEHMLKRRFMRRFFCWSALLIACPICARGQWLDLPHPDSTPLLIVRGALSLKNVNGEAHLDRGLLESFGISRMRTWAPWSEAVQEFEGVLLYSLAQGLGASGEVIRTRALNEYEVQIPIEDMERYDILVAWSRNGVALTRRDKGPLWLIYPWSNHPELDNAKTRQRSIWQLYEIEFQG